MRFMKSYPHLRSVLRLTMLVWLLVALLIGIAPATAQTIPLSEVARLAHWNPDSSAVAIITWEYRLWIWSDTGTYLIAEGFYDDVTWSPDGQQIALLKRRGAVVIVADIEIWQVSDPANPVLVRSFEVDGFPDESPYEVHWQPDGDLVAVTGTGIRLYDTNTGNLVRTLLQEDELVLNMDWSPDGSRLVTGDRESLLIWDIVSGIQIKELPVSFFMYNVQWSSDDTYIAIDQNSRPSEQIYEVLIFDLVSSIPTTFLTSEGPITLLDVKDDILSVFFQNAREVQVWRVSTQELLTSINDGVYLFPEISSDGSKIIYETSEGTLEVITIPDHTPD